MAGKFTKSEIIQHDTRIGQIAAESDEEFLFECFVDSKALAIALDLKSPGMIVCGRTGSGKTAILKYIEKYQRTCRIDPSELAMEYLTNSDVLRFLNDIGADLDILFQTIWKHVLCVEYIRLRYGIEDKVGSQSWYGKLWGKFSMEDRQLRALDYLRQWEGKFWITVDENVKEITEKYLAAIQAEIGFDIKKFKSKAGYGRNMSSEQKSEIIARVRKVINSQQLADLSKVLDLLSNEESYAKFKQGCYILIDDLDERWVDDSIRYRLVRALIESLKQFRKIASLKIIVSLRTDVLERVLQENKDSGFQREKYNDFIINIRWDERQLRELVQKRIRYLYRRKYTKQDVAFYDVFSPSIRREETLKYIIDRTLLRPRDIISFVNYALEVSENKVRVDEKDITNAERRKYSPDRLRALHDEWRSAFPTLDQVTKFLVGGPPSRTMSEFLKKENCEMIALSVCERDKEAHDPLYNLASAALNASGKQQEVLFQEFTYEAVSVLYRVGMIGLKPDTSDPFQYSFIDQPIISAAELNSGSRVRPVRMLFSALRISEGRPS